MLKSCVHLLFECTTHIRSISYIILALYNTIVLQGYIIPINGPFIAYYEPTTKIALMPLYKKCCTYNLVLE